MSFVTILCNHHGIDHVAIVLLNVGTCPADHMQLIGIRHQVGPKVECPVTSLRIKGHGNKVFNALFTIRQAFQSGRDGVNNSLQFARIILGCGLEKGGRRAVVPVYDRILRAISGIAERRKVKKRRSQAVGALFQLRSEVECRRGAMEGSGRRRGRAGGNDGRPRLQKRCFARFH